MSEFWTISIFWGCILLFIAVALAFVLPPLLRKTPAMAQVDRSQANIAIYQDQLQELQADLASGALSQNQYQSARMEIEKRLSEDVPAQADRTDTVQPKRWAGWALIGIIPLTALTLYMLLGNPEAVTMSHVPTAPGGKFDPEAMVASLEAKLKNNPTNAEGWYMLGRSYATLGRFKESVRAFEKTVELMPNDAHVLADYADVLAMTQNGSLNGKPTELINQALRLDDQDAKVLNLAAAAAYQQKDYAHAIGYWRQLLKLTPPESEFYKEVAQAIDEAEKLTGKADSKPQDSTSPVAHSISGTVSVSEALRAKIDPADTVFIFAQAPQGSKMPLASVKIQAKQLPYRFTLDDSMAMVPNNKLSNHPELIITARVSKSGQPMSQTGDLQGKTSSVKLGQKDLSIDINSIVH